MPFSVLTTVPGPADTSKMADEVPSFGLVLLWSAAERHRVGEIAFFPAFEPRLVGRGDVEAEKFALFGRHRPGETHDPSAPEGFLAGDNISRRQLRLRATAVALEMEQVGKCTTLVNGEERPEASLQPGDTVMLRKGALLLCVRRSRTLPAPAGATALHPFGEADAAGIVGESPEAWQLRAQIVDAAAVDDHVLIRGETGTGKELAAAAIHEGSRRAKGPYIDHSASNFTTTLLESQLFGNLANYPSHGMPARKGIYPSADGGTLFLDEIGECSHEAQAQLLRAMAVGSYKPVGESISRRANVRVIGATHRGDDYFREDFRGRLVASVRVPSICERLEDIPLLLRHLLIQRAQTEPKLKRFMGVNPEGKPEPRIHERLIDYLVRQPFSRNVRGMLGILVAAVAASPGDEVRLPSSMASAPPSLLPLPNGPPANGATESGGREQPSKEELLACLDREEGVVSRVARRLGVHRSTVYRLMETYGIERGDKEG